MLNYGILAQLCDPILDRVPTYCATQQVATFHEAILGLRGYSIGENCARGHRQLFAASKAQGRQTSEPSTLPRSLPRGYTRFSQAPEAGSGVVTERRGGAKKKPRTEGSGAGQEIASGEVSSCGTNSKRSVGFAQGSHTVAA
jgi:hypothetical protein